jgi:hypothetical protein
MADTVPANYDELTASTKLPSKEAGLEKVRTHYLGKHCKVYLANKKALSKKKLKGADFIIVCPAGDGKCVAIIEVKDGNSDCRDAIGQIKSSVDIAQAAGYIGAGANPSVSICVYNSELVTMSDQDALNGAGAEITIGTDKKKPQFINKNGRLPC